ncbi:hypothetical protein ASPWEDRAFT_260272 [Aspergillus wentii DTO 134E9]|uniref:Uncharacterized protein n=1 Tax=Aspergillus wentii DTO 134E9 TaxID=1073089 RepID=A0A1L9S2E8_ASPWE|nr:uncharacterized protein ASPWEDRAFT_260272 [Aspergillus wentii DTO 134E9]OJJ41325.1 hypothetical protein ASPWEDRAFT_260272 [Aspergillus wentii DTO 134E9]
MPGTRVSVGTCSIPPAAHLFFLFPSFLFFSVLCSIVLLFFFFLLSTPEFLRLIHHNPAFSSKSADRPVPTDLVTYCNIQYHPETPPNDPWKNTQKAQIHFTPWFHRDVFAALQLQLSSIWKFSVSRKEVRIVPFRCSLDPKSISCSPSFGS